MKFNWQGKDIDVDEVEVLSCTEPWSQYQLSDGTVLSIKTVLVSVLKARKEKNSDGTTLYITKSSNILKSKESERS